MNNPDYSFPDGSLIGFMSNKVKQFGGINLAQGIPGFSPPAELLQLLAKASAEEFHQYAPGNGNLSLRNLIINHYRNFLPVDHDNLLITNGATEALSLIFLYISTLHSGPFGVMAFTPVYESYRQLPFIYGKKFFELEVDFENLDFESIGRFINQRNIRVIFLSTPGNPLGYTFRKDQIYNLLELCQQHRCFLILDAVYRELYFKEPVTIDLKSLSVWIFYVDSFSKLLSITGWRIGFIFCSPHHMQWLRSIHDYTGLCSPSVLQEALARYLEHYAFGTAYTQWLREILATNYKKLSGELEAVGFKVIPAQGGYFVWARLPQGFNDGFRFAIELYEKTKVAVVPGIHFSSSARNFIRLNIARPENEILTAMEKIREFIGKR